MSQPAATPLLEVRDLVKHYPLSGGWLTGPPMTFHGEFLSLSPRRALLVDGPAGANSMAMCARPRW